MGAGLRQLCPFVCPISANDWNLFLNHKSVLKNDMSKYIYICMYAVLYFHNR